MRKALIAVIMAATAITPVAAHAQDRGSRAERRSRIARVRIGRRIGREPESRFVAGAPALPVILRIRAPVAIPSARGSG